MKEDNSEIILYHNSANFAPVLGLLSLATFLCFSSAYKIFPTHPCGSYFCIAGGIILTGLTLIFRGSKSAYLKLSQSAVEWKPPFSYKRVYKALWTEIKSINLCF